MDILPNECSCCGKLSAMSRHLPEPVETNTIFVSSYLLSSDHLDYHALDDASYKNYSNLNLKLVIVLISNK
jgi:hypothetical protein